jgi:hypothetical protein
MGTLPYSHTATKESFLAWDFKKSWMCLGILGGWGSVENQLEKKKYRF